MAREVLLITGSSGIAAATARMWAPRNPVFLIAVDGEQCRALAAELGEAGHYVADVRDEEAVRAAVAACLRRFGRVDAVFNVAGISARPLGDGPLHECTSAAWDAVMDVNAKGTFHVCREVLRIWVGKEQRGVILNMGSVLARHPQREHFATAGYAASKGAIEALSLAAAAYYAPRGIRINVLAPGLVRTPMSARAQQDARVMEYVAHKQPLAAGMISAEEVAKMACFLLGPDSGAVTGQVISVDAGWSGSE